MRDIADYLVGGYADSVYPDNLRIFHYGNCPVLKGPIVVKVQYNKHGEYVGTTGNISIASGQTKTFCLEHYVPYDGIPGNAIVIWLVSEGAPPPPPPPPPPEPPPEPPPPTDVGIPSAFQPYIVNISGLSTSQDVSWKGVPVLIWWGAGSVTLKGRIKVAVQYATKAGEQISWNEYIIESGQTRTFSNVTGQDMSIYLLETEPTPTYTCPYCGATFSTQAELDDHIAAEHPEDGPKPSVSGIHLMFGVDEGQNFNRVRDAGVNLIFDYGYHGRSYLDKAQSAGLYVIHNLKFLTSNRMAGKSAGEQWNIWNSSKSEMASLINQVKGHPALHAHYILEEPNLTGRGVPLDLQQDIYNFVKSVDPHSAVTFSMAGGPGDLGYRSINFNACDFIIPDTYGFGGPGSGGLTDLNFAASSLRSYLDSKGINTPVVFTIQACSDMGTGWQGHIRDQIDIVQRHNVATGGVGMYAWNLSEGGGSDDRTFNEIRDAWGVSTWEPPAPPPPTYTCPYCGATFSTQKELNDHIASEHPVETFTTEDITCSRCGSRLRVTISSIPANNVIQSCGVCGLSGVATGTKIEILHAEPWPPPTYTCPHCGATFSTQEELDEHIASEHPAETFTTKQVTCTPCSSILRVTISSIAENNRTLTCPLCQTTLSQAGTKVEIVSTPVIDQLRADIKALDEQIGQAETKVAGLKDTIAEAKAKVDAIKKLLGM